jgi:hypothetical protein
MIVWRGFRRSIDFHPEPGGNRSDRRAALIHLVKLSDLSTAMLICER